MPEPTRDCSIHDYDFSLVMRFCKIKARYFGIVEASLDSALYIQYININN